MSIRLGAFQNYAAKNRGRISFGKVWWNMPKGTYTTQFKEGPILPQSQLRFLSGQIIFLHYFKVRNFESHHPTSFMFKV